MSCSNIQTCSYIILFIINVVMKQHSDNNTLNCSGHGLVYKLYVMMNTTCEYNLNMVASVLQSRNLARWVTHIPVVRGLNAGICQLGEPAWVAV